MPGLLIDRLGSLSLYKAYYETLCPVIADLRTVNSVTPALTFTTAPQLFSH